MDKSLTVTGDRAVATYRPPVHVRAARAVKQFTSMVFSRYGGLVWRFLPRTKFDYAHEVGDGLRSSLVMAPLAWMARTFPEAPVEVYDEDGAPVEKHPMPLKLRRPNEHYSGVTMWMATMLSWVVDGNAYWIIVRNRAETGVSELWYVPHWTMEPEGNERDFISHYIYTVDGIRTRLEVEDVVHYRYGIDPHNPRKGMSPLNSVLREVFTDDEAANFSASMLRNLGVPGLMVSPESVGNSWTQPPPDDVKATKEYVRDNYTRDRRGEPLVMSGPTKVQQFGFSPEQLTLRDLRRIPEERVTAVLGLPAIIAGFGAGLDRSTFANYSEAREAAYEENIIPTQRMFAEELRHQLLRHFEDEPDKFEVGFDTTNVRVLQEDRNQEASRLGQLYKDGLITRREGREELGRETSEVDDVFAVALNVVFYPRGESAPLLPEPPPPGDEDGDEGAPAAEEENGNGQTAQRARAVKVIQTERMRRFIITVERDRQVLESVFAGEILSDLRALGDAAASAYLEVVNPEATEHQPMPTEDPPELSEAAQAGTKQSDRQLARRVEALMGLSEFARTRWQRRYESHYLRTAHETVRTLNGHFGMGVMLPNTVEREIMNIGGTRAGLADFTNQARESLLRSISAGREAGHGTAQIARSIREAVPRGRFTTAGAQYRAKLIARTETKFAQNVSSLRVYRDAPTIASVMAFDAILGESDPECEARNGQTFTFDEAEIEMANEHPNGTLSFAPVTPEAVVQELSI